MSELNACFERVCAKVAEKVATGYGISSPQAQELETALSGFEAALVRSAIFPEDWMHKHSIGKGNLASVMWVVFLPPGQTTQDGIYVSICFGKQGNGLVTGCAISNTSQKKYKDVPTVKRSNPEIDVDGTRPGTHYNNGYVNPLEVKVGGLDEGALVAHLKNSISLCETCIANHQDEMPEQQTDETEEVVAGGPRDIQDEASIGGLSVDDLDVFMDRLKNAHLQYDAVFVRRFFAALQAKRFVVLTGLSGSGKTQLALQFCEMFAPGRHAVVSVGADWTNNEKMLGYPDAMNPGHYVKPETGVLDLVLKAAKDSDNSYVLILDEMNLSHVERYFADFLSAMESGGELKLHGRTGELLDGVPATVKMPQNLWVIGTMNVDETTYMFSPKVLDRAQVLEFRVKAAEMAKFLEGKQDDAAEALNGFFPELAKVGAEFGYRTAGEFCSFVEKAAALGSPIEEAVDAAIMQKLLPKLHGSRRQLEKPLEALWKLCLKKDSAASVETLAKVEGEIDTFPYTTNCLYPISAEKIARLFKNAKDNGFASYAEA